MTETASLTSGQEMLITFLAHVSVFCSTLRQYLHVPSCGQLVHKRLPHHPDPTKTITSSLSLPSAKCAVRSKAQGRLKQQVQVAARSPHLDSAKKLVDDDVCGIGQTPVVVSLRSFCYHTQLRRHPAFVNVLTTCFAMHSPLVDGKTCCLLGGLWSIGRICSMRPIGGKAPASISSIDIQSTKVL